MPKVNSVEREPRMLEKDRPIPIASFQFVLKGAPRTKKNHGRRVRRGRKIVHIPSEAYCAWNDSVQAELATMRSKTFVTLPFKVPVNCRALFYRDANTGDAVGYYQGLADALQEGLVVEDDKLIVSWDGTRLLKDANNPRVEILLEAAE